MDEKIENMLKVMLQVQCWDEIDLEKLKIEDFLNLYKYVPYGSKIKDMAWKKVKERTESSFDEGLRGLEEMPPYSSEQREILAILQAQIQTFVQGQSILESGALLDDSLDYEDVWISLGKLATSFSQKQWLFEHIPDGILFSDEAEDDLVAFLESLKKSAQEADDYKWILVKATEEERIDSESEYKYPTHVREQLMEVFEILANMATASKEWIDLLQYAWGDESRQKNVILGSIRAGDVDSSWLVIQVICSKEGDSIREECLDIIEKQLNNGTRITHFMWTPGTHIEVNGYRYLSLMDNDAGRSLFELLKRYGDIQEAVELQKWITKHYLYELRNFDVEWTADELLSKTETLEGVSFHDIRRLLVHDELEKDKFFKSVVERDLIPDGVFAEDLWHYFKDYPEGVVNKGLLKEMANRF